MLGTDPVLPLAIAVLELLGLLGPEPGALLHRDETGPETQRGRGVHMFTLKTHCSFCSSRM